MSIGDPAECGIDAGERFHAHQQAVAVEDPGWHPRMIAYAEIRTNFPTQPR